jgi:Putative Ig domain
MEFTLVAAWPTTIRSGGTAMTITVEGNPPEGMEGDSYYTELTAAGGTPPYTWEYDTPLPDGLSLMPLPGNQRVAIQGVPSGAGSTQCTIIVTDSAGDTGFLKFTLKINQQLAISTRGLPSGIEGKPYKAKLKAKGGGKSYTWTAPGAPDGLRIDANTGEIAGTPAVADTPLRETSRLGFGLLAGKTCAPNAMTCAPNSVTGAPNLGPNFRPEVISFLLSLSWC